ncbi:MAG: DUF455 family protein [Myxococcota bacterium]
MDHSAWALRVLAGDTLADKLAPPFEGAAAGPVPDEPGRPRALRPRAGARVAFPGEHALHDAEARGHVLHFFANHELLALEVMAHALLRFPEAPDAFRRGLAGVMADEQRHLAGYLARMEATGVRFGDLPVNRYFWDALTRADLVGLVAGLSLTFEQANLDFAAHYAAAFREAGDGETADALDVVLADEIRHVRHGVAWFRTWRPGPLWEAWNAALPHPLTPARAKGTRFHRAPREAAGLDADTIARVEVFGASRGRPPRVHTFDPEVEAVVGGLPRTATGARIARDLAGVLVLIAGRDDVVEVPRAPSPAHLAELARAGVALPEVVEGTIAPDRTIAGYRPWGPTDCRALYEKTWAADRLRELGDDAGIACRAWEEVLAVATEGHVLKAPLGTAGRGNRRFGPDVEAWAREVIARQGAILVEPWLARVLDLSVQFDVGEGHVRVHPWGRFLTDDRGRYRGAVLGRALDDVEPAVRRLLREQHGRLVEAAEHLGRAMAATGFRGPAGMDALVHRTGDGYALKRIVELNPRVTMGRVANALGRRVRPGRTGLWVQVSREEARAKGFRGLADWAADLRARAPLAVAGEPAQVTAGALFTTDPDRAERIVTVLVVADGLDACRRILG